MTNVSVIGTPMALKPTTVFFSHNPLGMHAFYPCAKSVGEIIYCSNWTRPYITMAINYLNWFTTLATVRHWE